MASCRHLWAALIVLGQFVAVASADPYALPMAGSEMDIHLVMWSEDAYEKPQGCCHRQGGELLLF
jgi:hypothetical protein